MKVDLIESFGTDLTPVNAARVSFANESDWELDELQHRGQDGNTWSYKLSSRDAKLIHYLAKHRHTSCFEHQGATCRLKVPIFIARQIQRHRTFAYNEVSRRYVDNAPEFFWPDVWRGRADNVKQGSSDVAVYEFGDHMRDAVEVALQAYNDALSDGLAPELARIILPQNMYTEFYMTGNLRSWAHFLKLRLDDHAQLEVQQVAQQVEALLRPAWPVSMEALMAYD